MKFQGPTSRYRQCPALASHTPGNARPSVRGPGNTPPVSVHAGWPASLPCRSPRPLQVPGPPPLAWAGFSAALPRARFLRAPRLPQPRGAPPPCPARLGYPRGSRRGGSCPAAGCSLAPPGPWAAQREGAACPTPATGRRWRLPATGAAWPRGRCCSAPRGRGNGVGKGAAAGRVDTSCQECVPAA